MQEIQVINLINKLPNVIKTENRPKKSDPIIFLVNLQMKWNRAINQNQIETYSKPDNYTKN